MPVARQEPASSQYMRQDIIIYRYPAWPLGVALTLNALVAGSARRLFSSTGAVRLVNRGSGVIMAGAAAAIARGDGHVQPGVLR